MTLCDTGPLVALLDVNDANHARCVAALPRLPQPLLTTWPCLTEAMHFAHRAGGYPAQEALWRFVDRSVLALHTISDEERMRMQALMAQYQDAPMDLADASLVVAAETLSLRRVFTLDRHFYAYQIGGMQPFEVVP